MRGPVHRHRDERVGRPDVGRALLRHDRPQDGGADRRGSIEAGALLATDDDEVVARYRAFGWALGIAFQLNDDLLGIWGAEQATGKEPTDIARHKKTLPVIYAFEHAGPEDRERLADLYRQRPTRRPTTSREIMAILERTGALDFSRNQARRYRDEALAELDAAGVIDGHARARLEQIIVSVISA